MGRPGGANTEQRAQSRVRCTAECVVHALCSECCRARRPAGARDHRGERPAWHQCHVEYLAAAARPAAHAGNAAGWPDSEPAGLAHAGIRGIGCQHAVCAAPVGGWPGCGGRRGCAVRVLPGPRDRRRGSLSPAVRRTPATDHRRRAAAGDRPRPAGAGGSLAWPADLGSVVHRRGTAGGHGAGERDPADGAGSEPAASRARCSRPGHGRAVRLRRRRAADLRPGALGAIRRPAHRGGQSVAYPPVREPARRYGHPTGRHAAARQVPAVPEAHWSVAGGVLRLPGLAAAGGGGASHDLVLGRHPGPGGRPDVRCPGAAQPRRA